MSIGEPGGGRKREKPLDPLEIIAKIDDVSPEQVVVFKEGLSEEARKALEELMSGEDPLITQEDLEIIVSIDLLSDEEKHAIAYSTEIDFALHDLRGHLSKLKMIKDL